MSRSTKTPDPPVALLRLPKPILEVTLDIPPDVSNRRRGSARRARSGEISRLRQAAGWAWTGTARSAGVRGPIPAPLVRARFFWATRRRRDRDNAAARLKPYWDGLEDAGLVADDAELIHLPVGMSLDRERPRVGLALYSVDLRIVEPRAGKGGG